MTRMSRETFETIFEDTDFVEASFLRPREITPKCASDSGTVRNRAVTVNAPERIMRRL